MQRRNAVYIAAISVQCAVQQRNAIAIYERTLSMILAVLTRILDILILQDKTLFCACVDNLKQNGVFWRQQYRPSASEHGQNITNITMIKKNQLCRFIDMENILADGTMSRMPRKEIWGQG